MDWKGPAFIAVLLSSLLSATLYYRHRYQQAESARQRAVVELTWHQKAFTQLHQQMKTVSLLDEQHTRQLEEDQHHMAQLERDVAAHRRQLYVKATCPCVPKGTASARVDDATGPRLNDPAQRDYFTLRRRIETTEEQIKGLQHYVRQVCLIKN